MLFLPQFRKEGVYKSRGYSFDWELRPVSREIVKYYLDRLIPNFCYLDIQPGHAWFAAIPMVGIFALVRVSIQIAMMMSQGVV